MRGNKTYLILSLAMASAIPLVSTQAVADDISVDKIHTTTSVYDDANHVVENYDSQATSGQSTNGNTTTYSYDSQALAQDNSTSPPTTYSYDAQDNAHATTSGGGTTYTYDDQDRVQHGGSPESDSPDQTGSSGSYTDNFNGTTTYQYDHAADQVEQADPQGRVTRSAYDDQGNVASVEQTDPDTNTTGQENSTQTTYDAQDRVIQTTDDLDTTTTYSYDSVQGEAEFTPDLSTQTEYDAQGQIMLESGDGTFDLDLQLYDETDNQTIFKYDHSGTLNEAINGGPTRYEYDNLSQSNLSGMLTPGHKYLYSYSYDLTGGAHGGGTENQFNLLLPVPLPASVWMGGVLLAGISALRLRRKPGAGYQAA